MLSGVCSPSQRATNVSQNVRQSAPRATSRHLELDQDTRVQRIMNTRIQAAAEHWKARAAEARQLAAAGPADTMKRTFLDIAAEFEKLAERAERQQQTRTAS